MVKRLKENFDEPLRKRSEELGMSENEVLALASIIEREAIYDKERPKISAVYHNRLKKNMRLQADPTVLYGVKERWKRIRYRDLKRKTPYNTYRFKGLPPGPIASPGIKSRFGYGVRIFTSSNEIELSEIKLPMPRCRFLRPRYV